MECIDRRLATGANYLLNVGPDAQGIIPQPAVEILQDISKWMKPVRSSFDAQPTTILENRSLLTTKLDHVLYVHCPEQLISSTLVLKPIKKIPVKITLLNTGQQLEWTFTPLIHNQDKTEYLRIRNVPTANIIGTVVLKIEF